MHKALGFHPSYYKKDKEGQERERENEYENEHMDGIRGGGAVQ
jgi:hypothetical protein